MPNRRAGRNKHAGRKILKKTLNVQARIDMQGTCAGGILFSKSIKVQIKIRPCRGDFFFLKMVEKDL